MLEWLVGHAVNGLYSLLTRTLLRPMIWSGQQIRCAREEIRALDISLHNARMRSPGASPTEQFFQYRRKQLWRIGLHSAVWLIVLLFSDVWAGSAGLFCAALAVVLVVVGYFHVDVSGMPTAIEPQRK